MSADPKPIMHYALGPAERAEFVKQAAPAIAAGLCVLHPTEGWPDPDHVAEWAVDVALAILKRVHG